MDDLTVIKQKHSMNLDELLILYKYRYHRYGLQFSLLFCYGPDDFDLTPYASFIRLTDSFAKLENNFYAIVFEGVDAQASLKAANNIIRRFKRDNQETNIYLAAVSVKECSKDMTDDLFTELEKTLKSGTPS